MMMDEQKSVDGHLRFAPLVLRLSVAAVLIYSGIHQISPMLESQSTELVAADAAGVSMDWSWTTVLGLAQCAVGGLWILGWFTRLVSLTVMGAIGYAGYASMVAPESETLSFVAQTFQSNQSEMLLLGAVCASLLISGAGCLGLDCRKAKRGQELIDPTA
jgi:uncharacterized membrane protein YphA (DoxX/SURF4 family)